MTIIVLFEFQSGWVQTTGPFGPDIGQPPEVEIAARWSQHHASPHGPNDPVIAATAVHQDVLGTRTFQRTKRFLPAGNGDLSTPGGWVPA